MKLPGGSHCLESRWAGRLAGVRDLRDPPGQGHVAQRSEHFADNEAAGGSSPPVPTRPTVRSSSGQDAGPSTRRHGFESRTDYCGVAKLVRRWAHNPEMRGFESRPRDHRKRRPAARQGRNGRQSAAHIPPWLNRQSSVLLKRGLEVRVLSGERMTHGAVAQLVRAPDCRSGGRGFESRQSRTVSLAM